jgi:hypothetical protein
MLVTDVFIFILKIALPTHEQVFQQVGIVAAMS